MARIIGELTEEERKLIAERDDYRDKFRAAQSEAARTHWLAKIDDCIRRYDALRHARWEKGEIR